MLCSSGVLVGKRKGGFGKLKQVTMPPKQAKPKEDHLNFVMLIAGTIMLDCDTMHEKNKSCFFIRFDSILSD